MKKNYLIILAGCATMLMASCTDYLDVKPFGKTIPKTPEEFSALLHNRLQRIDNGEDEYIVGNITSTVLWETGTADNFEASLSSTTTSTLGTYVGNIVGSGKAASHYSNLYETIRDCNIVLGEMKDNSALADSVRATAYAMRGVCYYQLMRLFCEPPRAGQMDSQLGLPLVTTFDLEAQPNRSTLQQTVARIEEDLNNAINYHMKGKAYRFSEEVCKGYLARLYFWTQQWDKALTLAQSIVDAHPLLSGDQYTQMVTTQVGLRGNQLLKSYMLTNSSTSLVLSGTYNSIASRPVSIRLLNDFYGDEKTKDIRYNLWVNKKRISQKIAFCGMRSAEFQLIAAESLYHLGRTQEALDAINALRAKRISDYTPLTMDRLPALNPKEYIQKDCTGQSVSPLLGLILSERRKELFMEGDRFFELKRNGTPEFWTAYNGLRYTTESYMYTFPIPYHELELNKGLVQNPGYTALTSN